MAGETLVAVYASRAEAERVRDRLRSVGVPDRDIRLSIDTDNDQRFAPVSGESGGAAGAPKQEEGFFAGSSASACRRAIRLGTARRCARAARRSPCAAAMARSANGSRLSWRVRFYRVRGRERRNGGGDSFGRCGANQGRRAGHPSREVEVGKRPVERRHRICTYVVERPVEEHVNLRDERVVVERRPVTGKRRVGAEGIQEREVEVIERHEEPVVAKKAKAVEEVAVRKEAKKRTETVRDKVRETKVEVDKKAAGNKPGTSKPGPRKPAQASRAPARRAPTSRAPASRAPARRPTVSGRHQRTTAASGTRSRPISSQRRATDPQGGRLLTARSRSAYLREQRARRAFRSGGRGHADA